MRRTISATREQALRMEEEMQGCGTMQLMMLRLMYLEEMVKLLPLSLLSAEVEMRALRGGRMPGTDTGKKIKGD